MKFEQWILFISTICLTISLAAFNPTYAGRGGSRDDHSGGDRNNRHDEDSEEDSNSGSGDCDNGSDRGSDEHSSGGGVDNGSDDASDTDSDNDNDDDSDDNSDNNSDHCSSDQVTLCHVPPGNPAAAHTITVGASAVSAHVGNHDGDVLGDCPVSADSCNDCLYDASAYASGGCAETCGFLIK